MRRRGLAGWLTTGLVAVAMSSPARSGAIFRMEGPKGRAAFSCSSSHLSFGSSSLTWALCGDGTTARRTETFRLWPRDRGRCKLLQLRGDGGDAVSGAAKDDERLLRASMQKAAGRVQRWLEEVYESVDYEAALVRAGALSEMDLLNPCEGQGQAEADWDGDEGEGVLATSSVQFGKVEDPVFLPMEMEMTIDGIDRESVDGISMDSPQFDIVEDPLFLPMEMEMTIDGMSDDSHSSSSDDMGAISEGKDGELTYGEMDLELFLAVLKYLGPPQRRKFIDIGCGRGQLVLTAALIGWRRCEGIEIMPDVLEIGRGALDVLRGNLAPTPPTIGAGGAAGFDGCQLHLGDMYVDTAHIKDADVVFVYATCFATEDGETLGRLSRVFAEHVRTGTTIVTVNKRLKEADGFHLEETLFGRNPDSVSSDACVFIWRRL